MTKLVTLIKGDKLHDYKVFDVVAIISDTLKVSYLEARQHFKQITHGGLDITITEDQFNELKPAFLNLTYETSASVSQEQALYGTYPIDKERLTMANAWYEKQTPEVQNFVDLLIRNNHELMTPQEIIEAAQEVYPEIPIPTDLVNAIVGWDSEHGRFIMSKQKTIDIYIDGGMTWEEAIEYLEYNPIRATKYMEIPLVWMEDTK